MSAPLGTDSAGWRNTVTLGGTRNKFFRTEALVTLPWKAKARGRTVGRLVTLT